MKRLWRALYWNALYPIHRAVQVRRAAAGDRRKLHAVQFVQPYTMVGFERLMNAYDLVRRAEANELPGAIVECGVFKGGSAAVMTMAASSKRQVWLFDSFEGLPEPTAEDGAMAVEYAGQRASGALEPIGQCVGPLDVVKELFFEKLAIAPSRINIRQGWFQDTLPVAKDEIGPIAVLRLDGDWYDSTKVCFENLYDLVVPGGFILIDDYGYWEGCRRAVDEFLAARKLEIVLHAVDDSGVWFEVP
ncbi:MAG: TylF/MycF family methyltransferase [Acidobacteriota bacterium]|nr:TylF/MycF family methyltransferase [Acidobacteriota bacterium]